MDTDIQARLGNALLKNLIGLREKKGQILIEDVGAILEGLASSIPGNGAPNGFLRKEIENMANYIIRAREELAEMVPDPEQGAPQNISAASMELSEVVSATEAATNAIMDAADVIQQSCAGIKDEALRNKMMDASIKIYDACTFQDITGQRINKAIRTFENLEARIFALLELFGGKAPEGYTPPKGTMKIERPDEALMSGPQMNGDVPSQDDIDRLFESL